jgi:hypothetical protein
MAKKAPQPIDDDDEDEDDAPNQGCLFRVFLFLSTFVWLLLFIGVLLGTLIYFTSVVRAQNVMQQASLSSSFTAMVVAGYVLARCLEKLVANSKE